MADLVDRIWAGPFEAHDANMRTVQPGEIIQVTAKQAEDNPGWFQPLPAPEPVKAARPAATASEPEAAE